MLSSFSVKRPYTVIVSIVLIAILGFISLSNMNLELLPNINLPYTVIVTPYGGASPEQVEHVVTQPVEQAMGRLTNLKSIQSVSMENVSMVILEFQERANMDTALIEIRENLDLISASMPDGVGSSNVVRLNPDMLPIMVASVSLQDKTIVESSAIIEERVLPELERLEGVASVNASGLAEYQIQILIKEEAKHYGITDEMISNLIKAQNFAFPVGYVSNEGLNHLVRVGNKFSQLEDLEEMLIIPSAFPDMDPVRLKDVAHIKIVDTTANTFAMVNGEHAIILDIQKQTDYSTAAVADRIHLKMNELMKELDGLSIIPLMDQGEYVNIVISSISLNLLIGGLLAILILIVFLKDLKASITIALAIPISLVTAFVLMYFSGVSLNIISMGGLALGVGMLVDNSIVVIENIYRMRSEGHSPVDASIYGAKQVAGAITASTLTTLSVFLPIVFTDGLARQIFADMGLTIAYSLLASLMVSLTLVPMISSRVMSQEKTRSYPLLEKIKRTYGKILNTTLRWRWAVLILSVIMLFGSSYTAFQLGTEFIPPMNTGELMIDVELPEGISFDEQSQISVEIMNAIEAISEIETVGGFIGTNVFGMMGGGSQDNLSIYALLYEENIPKTQEVAHKVRQLGESLELSMTVSDGNMDMTMLAGGAISIQIYGRDLQILSDLSHEMVELLSAVDGTIDIESSIDTGAAEYQIQVNQDEALKYGLTTAQVYMEISNLLTQSQSIGKLTQGTKDLDIYLYTEETLEMPTFDEIKGLEIQINEELSIPLLEIISIEEADGFTSIRRTNQERYVTVNAGLADGYNIGLVSREIQALIDDYEVPEGFRIELSGEIEVIMESFSDLFLMLAVGVLFIYLIMVAQFQSLGSPFIVMFTIPLAFTGGFLALIITGQPVSIIAFLGLIILSGIVVNNGIVFVDYINKLREDGLEKRQAIVLAGQTRLRPIVMTALTTIIALSTLTLGVGQGVEIIQPMAITAVGGLIYATLLTLLIIPVLYDLLNRKDISVISKESTHEHDQ